MPKSRRATLDLFNFDGVLSLDVDAGIAVIDLTPVTFVDAYALTGLACFIASADGDGLPVRLLLPERYDVRSWRSRMHLGDVLDAFDVQVERSLPKVVERDRRDTLIELERFRDSHGSDRLASFIWERLQGGGADGDVVNQLYEATGELGLNVVEHAGSPVGGFIAAQRYRAGTPGEWIIVAVGDVGMGIRESLRDRYGAMTDDEAIRRAIEWYVSRVRDRGRGQGLPGVVDGVKDLGGAVSIRSGAASLTITGCTRGPVLCLAAKVRLSVLGCPAGQVGDRRVVRRRAGQGGARGPAGRAPDHQGRARTDGRACSPGGAEPGSDRPPRYRVAVTGGQDCRASRSCSSSQPR